AFGCSAGNHFKVRRIVEQLSHAVTNEWKIVCDQNGCFGIHAHLHVAASGRTAVYELIKVVFTYFQIDNTLGLPVSGLPSDHGFRPWIFWTVVITRQDRLPLLVKVPTADASLLQFASSNRLALLWPDKR